MDGVRWTRRRLVLGALAGTAVLAAPGCALLETRERELVFRPVRDDVRTPADRGLPYEELWIDVAGEGGRRERVHGWWIPAAQPGSPVALYLHGVRWSLGNNLFRIARWHALGFAMLAIDYRGFGRSDGALPSEAQIRADARAAWAELMRREPRREQRFIYGHSLGAAVAIDLAADVDGAAGVIAEAGFTSLADVVAERSRALAWLVTQRFDALERARALKIPALYVHGTADSLVPPAMSERLYAATPSPKRLHWIEGAGHGNWGGTGLDALRRTVVAFVADAQAHARAAAS